MSGYRVHARYRAQSGRAGEVAALLEAMAAASRTEPGNLEYQAFRALDDDACFLLMEHYVDAAAFAAHCETDHYRRILREGIIPLLADRTVSRLQLSGL